MTLNIEDLTYRTNETDLDLATEEAKAAFRERFEQIEDMPSTPAMVMRRIGDGYEFTVMASGVHF